MFTGKLATDYDPTAFCPLFTRVLTEALPDPDDRLLFMVFCGYILWPNCEHEVSLVAFGPGGTGKSTLAGAIWDVLGEALCSAAGLEELCKGGSYTLPTLKLKLLNLGSELEGNEIEESANFKKLVSGEHLMVRAIYGKPVGMQSTVKLMFLTNNVPRFRKGSDAETRRLRILYFGIKPKEKDSKLKDKLRTERSGILNWMLQGLLWLQQNRCIPEGGTAPRRLRERFDRCNDPVGAFVRERCVFEPDATVIKGDLLEEFERWCEENGMSSEKMSNYFFKTLLQRYPDLKDARRTLDKKREHCLTGIGLNPVIASDEAIEVKPNTAALLAKLKEIQERSQDNNPGE